MIIFLRRPQLVTSTYVTMFRVATAQLSITQCQESGDKFVSEHSIRGTNRKFYIAQVGTLIASSGNWSGSSYEVTLTATLTELKQTALVMPMSRSFGWNHKLPSTKNASHQWCQSQRRGAILSMYLCSNRNATHLCLCAIQWASLPT